MNASTLTLNSQNKIYINARTHSFPAEHCIGMRWSLFTWNTLMLWLIGWYIYLTSDGVFTSLWQEMWGWRWRRVACRMRMCSRLCPQVVSQALAGDSDSLSSAALHPSAQATPAPPRSISPLQTCKNELQRSVFHYVIIRHITTLILVTIKLYFLLMSHNKSQPLASPIYGAAVVLGLCSVCAQFVLGLHWLHTHQIQWLDSDQ